MPDIEGESDTMSAIIPSHDVRAGNLGPRPVKYLGARDYGYEKALERHKASRYDHLVVMSFGRANRLYVEMLVELVMRGRFPSTRVVNPL